MASNEGHIRIGELFHTALHTVFLNKVHNKIGLFTRAVYS